MSSKYLPCIFNEAPRRKRRGIKMDLMLYALLDIEITAWSLLQLLLLVSWRSGTQNGKPSEGASGGSIKKTNKNSKLSPSYILWVSYKKDVRFIRDQEAYSSSEIATKQITLARIFHASDALICKAFRGEAVVFYCKPLITQQMGASGSAQRVLCKASCPAGCMLPAGSVST